MGSDSVRAPEKAGQWLFRAEVSGEEGSGSLKLLLRRFDDRRFTLSAADALGQARWEIRRLGDEAVWFDPAGRRFCRLDARRPVRAALWVSEIRLADFPGLLTGEWPSPAEVAGPSGTPEPGAPDVGGDAGEPGGAPGMSGRWLTGDRDERGWASWTLWEEGAPAVWFKRLGAESLLSVRHPSVQVRWRVTAQSSLPPSSDLEGTSFVLLPGELLASAREIACAENEIP